MYPTEMGGFSVVRLLWNTQGFVPSNGPTVVSSCRPGSCSAGKETACPRRPQNSFVGWICAVTLKRGRRGGSHSGRSLVRGTRERHWGGLYLSECWGSVPNTIHEGRCKAGANLFAPGMPCLLSK